MPRLDPANNAAARRAHPGAAAPGKRAPGRLPRTAAQAQPSSKGEQTRLAILDMALAQAAQQGLEGLSIGPLAVALGMSKSGVFAHFGSREELQISVIHEYHHRFEQEVFYPALEAGRGVARLRAMFGNWMQRSSAEIDSGCIYISGAIEFHERTGPVRDALARSVMAWHAALRRSIEQGKERGELRADVDPDQMLFEIHGLILALHYQARFLQTSGAIARALQGFDNTVARFGTDSCPKPLSVSVPVPVPVPFLPGQSKE